MKTLIMLAAGLGSMALSAQSTELDVKVQVRAEVTQLRTFTYAQVGGLSYQDQADRHMSFGFRLQGQLPETDNWYYELGGLAASNANLGLNTTVLDSRSVQINYGYWSVGVAREFRLKRLVVGAHLEARGEQVEARGSVYDGNGVNLGAETALNHWIRPWVRVSAEVELMSGKLRPFVGGEVGMALARTNQDLVPATPGVVGGGLSTQTVRAMLPNMSAAVYAGLHF